MTTLIYKLHSPKAISYAETARYLDVGRDVYKNIVAVLDTVSRHGPTLCAL